MIAMPREYYVNYQEKHRKSILKASKKYRDKLRDSDPERYREMWVLSRYGLTTESFRQLLQKQENRCAICGEGISSPRFIGRNFCVDHDHKTGKVRGLLCHHCNAALGYLKDSLDNFRKAVEYLGGGDYIAGTR